jgi:hypothetical protein
LIPIRHSSAANSFRFAASSILICADFVIS